MRILWFSNAAHVPTGYGRQTALWVPRLASLGHEVAVASFFGVHGAPLNHGGMLEYPGSPEDMFARDLLPGHYAHFGADLVITLMDAWVLDPVALGGMRVAHWVPVDCSPLSAADRRVLSGGGGRAIAMSAHGRRELEAAGFGGLYVPHGTDTAVFAPAPERDAIRERLGFGGRFVIAMAAANQDVFRKGLAEQLEAFSVFAAAHREALMIVHARDATSQGLDLNAVIAALGCADQVIIGNQYQIAAGLVSDQDMARFFSIADVVSNCSWGEGFGLPVLEAQAAGTPVVVTDCSAMTELCGSGWLVEGSRFWNQTHAAWWCRPSVPAITGAYEEAFALWRDGGLGAYREKAREFALAYDADLVLAQHWVPVLKELCAA